ncbi:hypothetical protein FACS1894164_08840 [Spirochaetia bacterium]|nr:hypothetical protein FACS1894164_08840 [Spirochaetia bacterium]
MKISLVSVYAACGCVFLLLSGCKTKPAEVVNISIQPMQMIDNGNTLEFTVSEEIERLFGALKGRDTLLLSSDGSSYGNERIIVRLITQDPSFKKSFSLVSDNESVQRVQDVSAVKASLSQPSDIGSDLALSGYVLRSGDQYIATIGLFEVGNLRQVAATTQTYIGEAEVPAMIQKMSNELVSKFTANKKSPLKPSLSVNKIYVSGAAATADEAELVTQILSGDIANSGYYYVFPRTEAAELIERQYSEDRKAIESDYVLSASITTLGENRRLMVEIVSLKNGTIRESGSILYTNPNDATTLIRELFKLVDREMELFPSDRFVRLEGGSFQTETTRPGSNETILQTVDVRPFYITRNEVTQKEYVALTGFNPSLFQGDDLPVANVTWYEAIAYCNQLSAKAKLVAAYKIVDGQVTLVPDANGYRLPTEAEWEFAARAGATAEDVAVAAWYNDNSEGAPHPVGTKQANNFGIHDLYGNVGEWCWDWFQIPRTSEDVENGVDRVWRGGNFNSPNEDLAPSQRDMSLPTTKFRDIGFRVVASAD